MIEGKRTRSSEMAGRDSGKVVECLDIKAEIGSNGGRLWREFEEARPRILGALLDAVVAGLGNLPAVNLDQLRRMADFAICVSAGERALGLERGEGFSTYRSNL